MAENNSSAPLKTAVEPFVALGECIADHVCLNVAELPDRDSPADWPQAMLVTPDELRNIVLDAINDAAQEVEAQAPAAVHTKLSADAGRLAYVADQIRALEPVGSEGDVFLTEVIQVFKDCAEALTTPALPATEPARAAVGLTDALRDLIKAIEYTPLGIRQIKALERARAAIKTEGEIPATEDSSAGDLAADAHPDDAAVDALAAKMKAKLAKQRAKGYGGWDTFECTQQRLSDMLRDHVAKGDPVDVANFCAFLTWRDEGISEEPQAEPKAWLHQVVAADGEPDQALSFAPDNFPLAGVGGFRSIGVQPLYTARQSKAEVQEQVQPYTVDFDAIVADIQAIDTRHRGDPSYEHDPVWVRSKACDVVRRHACLSAAFQPQAEVEAEPVAKPPGIEALMCVISSLRDTGHISDEEGELTNDLRALRDWAQFQRTAPQAEPVAKVLGWVRKKNGEIGSHFFTYEPHCDCSVRDNGGEKIAVIAATAPQAQPADALDAQHWRDHIGKLDALVTYCPTCCQGFTAKPEMTRDEVIFECGKTVGRSAAMAAAQEGGAA